MVWEALLPEEDSDKDDGLMASDEEGNVKRVFFRSGRPGCLGLGLPVVDKLDASDRAERRATAWVNLIVGQT